MDEKVTKPTIETVLERVQLLEERLSKGFDARLIETEHRLGQRIDAAEHRLNHKIDAIETRLDRIEALTSTFRAEVLNLRADFRELRNKVDNQPNPS
jgi:hypothetical protein